MATSRHTQFDPVALHPDSVWAKLALHRVPSTYLAACALFSYLTLAVCYLQGVIPWLAFGLALMPWMLIAFVEIEWVYEHFGWFALFTLMAFVQTIHYSEHIIEVVQYHIFNDTLAQSIAIFSALNVEWVHFLGDTFLTIGTLLLLTKFPRNPWLWVCLPFQIAHQAEHTFLTFNYVFYGAKPGGPGLLASGGAIAGGLPLARPDLHFFYNTFFTIPFVIALIYQLKLTYDDSLDEAFPDAPKADLLAASKHLETFHYAAGETILAPGDDVDRLYILTDGEVGIYQTQEDGRDVEIARLHKGQYFGEIGLLVPGAPHTKVVRAITERVDVLAMDEATFRHLMSVSQKTSEEVAELARERMTPAAVPVKP